MKAAAFSPFYRCTGLHSSSRQSLAAEATFQSCPRLRGNGLPICCISGLVVAEASTGSGRRTPEKDAASQLFRERLLGFYKVALRRSEVVMGNHWTDNKKSTSFWRNLSEVSLNFSKIDEFEMSWFHKNVFRSKMLRFTRTTLPTSGLAWTLHRCHCAFLCFFPALDFKMFQVFQKPSSFQLWLLF